MNAASSSAIGFAAPRTIWASSSAWTRYFSAAALAASLDLVSKEMVTRTLGDQRIVSLTDRLSLMLVYNTGTAGGFSIGPFTFALNVLVTIGAIIMVMRILRPLSDVDPRAAMSLGLVTGGAFGNLASMIVGPAGVADFLALDLGGGTTVVMNVADLMLWSGALMLVPVVARLIHLVRQERTAQERAA